MLSKKVLKDIQSLGLKKHREEQGLFIAEGPKIVGELLPLIPELVYGVYATENWAAANPEAAGRYPLQVISEAELAKLSQLQTPNQVVLVARQLPSEEPRSVEGFVLYLDAIQDPGNFGTIVRIADWFGIKHLVGSKGCVDLYNPKVVQSTMASIARVNVWYDEDGGWLQRQPGPFFAAALEGTSLYDFKKKDKGVLLIGNESKGLHPALLEMATHKITIPRVGGAESLNAAVATGIILAHLTR